MRLRLAFAACLGGVAIGVLPVGAGPALGQDLKLAIGAQATTMDPHFHNAAPNSSVAAHFFDRLVNRAPDAALQPGLALRWTPVADTIWEFKLRPGVTWHDGAPFTADDVAFSLARAPNEIGRAHV